MLRYLSSEMRRMFESSFTYHLLVLTLQIQLYHPVHFLKHSAKLYYEKSMKSNFSLLLASRPNFWNRFLKMKKKYLQRIGCDFTRLCNLKKILLKLYLINFVYFSKIYKMIYKFSGHMDQSIDLIIEHYCVLRPNLIGFLILRLQ